MKEQEIIIKIKDFVEGKVSPQEILNLYQSDSEFRFFCNKYNGPHVEYKYKTMANFMKIFNPKNPNKVHSLSVYFQYHLYVHKVVATASEQYLLAAEEYSKVYPSWLPDNAYGYIENYIEPNMPKNLNEKEQKAWLKEQIKQTFRYEKKPPQFVQGGEWPMDENNKPLLFKKQVTKGEQVKFIFENENTKKETTYEEYY